MNAMAAALLSLLPLLAAIAHRAAGGSVLAKAVVLSNANYSAGEQPSFMGVIEFSQDEDSDVVVVKGVLTGLSAGEHGFHIHELGALDEGCGGAAGHFNPESRDHGGPTDAERHVGDLGNVRADGNGRVNVDVRDGQLALVGAHSIVGRALVVHADADDLGKGGHADSKTTGHAGARRGCGVVGIASPGYRPAAAASLRATGATLLLATLLAILH